MVHFAPQEYGQQPTNWAVVQDHRGLIYVANNDGILEYDGETWRTIRTVTNTVVRSLAVGDDGTVYAGAQGDFGYLRPDSTGLLRYESLITEVPEEHRDFRDVWMTSVAQDGVYFQARSRLFRWDGDQMTVWESEGLFHTSFSVRGQLFVREYEGRGLLRVAGDSLVPVLQGTELDEVAVYMMAPYPGGRTIVGTREGLFVLDGTHIERLPTQVDDYLADSRLYHGAALPDDRYALATLGGGVLVVDAKGLLKQVIDRQAGLPDEVVNHVYYDGQDGLWMALNNRGLFRVDMKVPVSVFDEHLGLEGVIHGIQRHDGVLYVATGSGLFRLRRKVLSVGDSGSRSSFEPVPHVDIPTHLLSTDDGLFVSTASGLYIIDEGEVQQLTETVTFVVSESDARPETLLVGLRKGVAVLKESTDGWQMRRVMPQFTSATHSIVETVDGTLWLGTRNNGVVRVRPTETGGGFQFDRFGKKHGLPPGYTAVRMIGERPAFLAKSGVYRIRETDAGVEFHPDSVLNNDKELLALDEDGQAIWMVYKAQVDIIGRGEDGRVVRQTPTELHFPEATYHGFIYIGDAGVAWISSSGGLIRYDPSQPSSEPTTFPPLFRSVQSLNSGRLVYGGADPGVRLEGTGDGGEADVELPFEGNDLRFAFAAPLFSTLVENEYQWYLEGHDAGWSDWTPTTYKTYTNLRPGTYRFKVRARNGLYGPSDETIYAFTILPPWYLTWWAYGLYAVGAVLLVFGGRHYHRIVMENRRVRQQAQELARERLANERLKQANETLKQANRLKDELLANTSHELRTPLTAILGFASILREEVSQEHHEFLDFISTNGERLLTTVNSLLDLAKIRAGMMEVERQPVDMVKVTDRVVRLLEPLARQKELELNVDEPDHTVVAYVDQRYVEQIVQNVVSNAVKFTEEGQVHVVLRRQESCIQIIVRDTGIGIDPAFLPHVFDDFKQESSGLDRSHEGSGLGLSIAARFVELMSGEIEVQSKKGHGSVFTVSLPAYRPHAQEVTTA